VSGTILYERLVLSAAGLGPARQTRPVRFVDVEVRLAGGGACYGRTSTNASGAYSLSVDPPLGSTVEVVVFSRMLADPTRNLMAHDALAPTFNAHSEVDGFSYASSSFPAASQVISFTVPYSSGPSNRPSIGFGALDTALTCWDQATAASGSALEPLHLYTKVGNNAQLGSTSFYSPTAHAISILGGAAGLPDNSDTDYFDEGVIAHEFSHFVDNVLSHSMSRGGTHGGELLEPNFSWSEGSATGFGCLLLGSPEYLDSTTTFGSLLFHISAENVTALDPAGIGGEFTVAEILWDLGDGGGGPADTDSDGVHAPLSDLYAALKSFSPATDGPYIGLFLDRLVALSASVSTATLSAFLSGPPENQGISYPLAGSDLWPTAFALGGADTGSLTSLVPNPSRALAASHWYQFTLPVGRVVSIDLTITPIPGSGDNLDLFLTTNEDVNLPLASSTHAGSANESISVSLAAGTYILRVQASGTSNRAAYNLTLN